MFRPDATVLPDAAREHAWAELWKMLLQPVPDDSPASDPRKHSDKETTAPEDEESAA